MLRSFADVIDAFGGPAAFARAVGMTAGAAKQVGRRDALGARWFKPTVEAAKVLGVEGVSFETLSVLAAKSSDSVGGYAAQKAEAA